MGGGRGEPGTRPGRRRHDHGQRAQHVATSPTRPRRRRANRRPRPSCLTGGGVAIGAGDDAQSVVNAHGPGTTYIVKAGVHLRNFSIRPKSGDRYCGEPGAVLDGGRSLPSAFSGGATDVTLDSITVRDYESGRQGAAIQPDSRASGWVVRNVSALHNSWAGLLVADGMRILGGHYNDNDQLGIGGNEPPGSSWTGSTAIRPPWTGRSWPQPHAPRPLRVRGRGHEVGRRAGHHPQRSRPRQRLQRALGRHQRPQRAHREQPGRGQPGGGDLLRDQPGCDDPQQSGLPQRIRRPPGGTGAAASRWPPAPTWRSTATASPATTTGSPEASRTGPTRPRRRTFSTGFHVHDNTDLRHAAKGGTPRASAADNGADLAARDVSFSGQHHPVGPLRGLARAGTVPGRALESITELPPHAALRAMPRGGDRRSGLSGDRHDVRASFPLTRRHHRPHRPCADHGAQRTSAAAGYSRFVCSGRRLRACWPAHLIGRAVGQRSRSVRAATRTTRAAARCTAARTRSRARGGNVATTRRPSGKRFSNNARSNLLSGVVDGGCRRGQCDRVVGTAPSPRDGRLVWVASCRNRCWRRGWRPGTTDTPPLIRIASVQAKSQESTRPSWTPSNLWRVMWYSANGILDRTTARASVPSTSSSPGRTEPTPFATSPIPRSGPCG